jgi:hypothetical protein
LPDMHTPSPVVFSATDDLEYTPPGSPRTYRLAPLTYRQRTAMLRDLRREGGISPDHATVLAGLRAALREVAPANLDELLAIVDAAEAEPDNATLAAQLRLVELAAIDVPAYGRLLDAQARWNEALPLVAARHALRGWSGPGLPPFPQDERIPLAEAVLDAIPGHELGPVGHRAYMLAVLGRRAEGNSAPPSPSPETPSPSPEG